MIMFKTTGEMILLITFLIRNMIKNYADGINDASI